MVERKVAMNLSEAQSRCHRWQKTIFSTGVLLLALAGRAWATDISWTNTSGGYWTNYRSWNPNIVPGFTDNAYITNSGTYTVTNNSASIVNNVFIGGSNGTQTLLISGVAVTLTNLFFPQTNGSLIGPQGVLTLSGTTASLSLGGPLTVAGTFNWSGGTIGGAAALTVATNGLLQILSASSNVLSTTVFNYGTTTWTSSSANLYFSRLLPAVVFVNEPGGVFTNRNGPKMTFVAGPPPPPSGAGFYNNGLFTKGGGTATTTAIQVPFYNSGTIQPLFGSLAFNDRFSLSSSSVLQFIIHGPTPGSQFGTIAVAPLSPAFATPGAPGSVQFAGTLDVGFTNFTPPVSSIIQLMTFVQQQAGFDAITTGSLPNSFAQVQLSPDLQSLNVVIKTTNSTPVIQTNMADQTVFVGGTATFIAPAPGVLPLAYQWYSGGNPLSDGPTGNGSTLSGTATATLSIANAQTADASNYCVTVTDALLNTFNYCANLFVYPPPFFTSQPSNLLTTNGGAVTLSVSVNATLPVQYQWRCNGAYIFGATNPVLTVTTNAQLSDGGVFDMLVTSQAGMLVSTAALVTVTGPALPFTNFPGGVVAGAFTNGVVFFGVGNNANATNYPAGPDIAGSPEIHPLWLQWTMPATNSVSAVAELDTSGSGVDTVAGVFTGTNINNLNLIGSDDDSGKAGASRVPFLAQPGTVYFFVVDGYNGATGNLAVTLALNTNLNTLAQFVSQPQDQAVAPGGMAVFSASVSNVPNANYQWYKNSVLKIPGATNATLTLSNAGYADVGIYNAAVTVGTNVQAVNSTPATLEIGPALSVRKLSVLARQLGQPNTPHLRFNTASAFASVAAGIPGQQLINNYNSQDSLGDPISTNGGSGGSSRWFLLTPTNSGTMQIDTMGSETGTTLTAFTNAGFLLFAQPVASDRNGAPDGNHSLVSFPALPNTNYLIRVDGTNSVQVNIALNWRLGSPPNSVGAAQSYAVAAGSKLPTLSAGQSNSVTSPAYQWQLNGTNIAGATNAALSVTNIAFNQCGSYTVIVSNLVGVITNPIALVSVNAPLKIAKDALTKNYVVSGSLTQAMMAVQLSTNLTSAWKSIYTNKTTLLPVIYLDVTSTNRNQGFYRLKSPP